MDEESQFIVDEDLQKRLDLLERVDKTIKSREAYTPKTIFLKRFTLYLIRAASSRIIFPTCSLPNDDPKINSEGVYVIREPPLTEQETNSLDRLRSLLEKNPSLLGDQPLMETLHREAMKSNLGSEFTSKALYYIYKHFMGFGALEPLINDPSIGGVYCSGIDTPVLIDYKDKKQIRTTLTFEHFEEINAVLLHLAQKAGVDVNDSQPILDGVIGPWVIKGLYGSNLINSKFSLVRAN